MTFTYPRVTRSAHVTAKPSAPPPWPGGARCMVAFTVDFDGTGNEVGKGFEPFGAHSAGRYSARRGIDRHLDMLDRIGVPATFFVPGYDAECSPEVVRRIAQAGHEIGAHGYVHEGMLLEPDEEVRRLTLTHTILSDLLGQAPRGWRSPSGQKTSVTLPTLKRLGYVYDSSDKDADSPYLLDIGAGESMVEIPNNTYSLDDFPFFNFSMTPVSEVVDQWKREFDLRYSEGGFFMLTVHPRSGWGSGTPRRTKAIEETLRYIQRHQDVRFVRLIDLYEHVNQTPECFDEVKV
jgi:peptidoglycan/xylan/chitin deacetylase (PgdA/CDA1 family)